MGDVIVSVLPFLLLIAFWLFLMRRMRSGEGFSNPTVDKLEEIRLELERIRRALESDPFRKT